MLFGIEDPLYIRIGNFLFIPPTITVNSDFIFFGFCVLICFDNYCFVTFSYPWKCFQLKGVNKRKLFLVS